MTQIQRWEPTGISSVDRAVAYWRPASSLPAQFKDPATGQPKLDDLTLAALWLDAIDVPPIPNLPQLYVVKGRVGMMAELQRALLARAGYDLEVVEQTAEYATVRIAPPGQGFKPPVTVTIGDAEKAGWTRRSSANVPSNYETIPDRMLAARACTKAISLYAPGVIHGIVAPADKIAPLDTSDPVALSRAGEEGDEPSGPVRDESGPDGQGGGVPPRSLSPSGATIPPHLREAEVDPETRVMLVERLQQMPEEPRLALAVEARQLGVPNVKSGWFTKAHAALVERLIEEHVGSWVPDEVHDDLPEANTSEEGGERYDPADNYTPEETEPF